MLRQILAVLVLSSLGCAEDLSDKYGYSTPDVPSDLRRYAVPSERVRGYDEPDPGKTDIDLHQRYLRSHRTGYCDAARQWELSGQFTYRYVRDIMGLDATWESLRGYWDGYQSFKLLACQRRLANGMTPFVLAMPANIPNQPVVLDATDAIFTLELHGVEVSDRRAAAYATESRKAELTQWQKQQCSESTVPVAIITAQEAEALWERLGCFDLLVRDGDPPCDVRGVGWVMRIASGRRRFYVDLGISDEAVAALEDFRSDLSDINKRPIDGVIDHLKRHMRSSTRRHPRIPSTPLTSLIRPD